MMWIGQQDALELIELAVGHHLVDIGLAYASFGVIDFLDALPLRVDDQDVLAVPLDDEVRSRTEPSCLTLVKAIGVAALRSNSEACTSERTGKHRPCVFLKEGIHLEQQRKAFDRAGGRLLMAIAQKFARKRQEFSPPRIRPVEHGPVPGQSWRRDFGDVRVREVQLAEGARIVRIPCEAGQLADGCPHDLIERNY